MKPLPMLFLHLATIVVALLVYDQVRGREVAPTPATDMGPGQDASLEERVAALEAGRAPMLAASATDTRVLERLAALEEALQRPDERAAPASGPLAQEDGPATPAASAAEGEPTEGEIRRFRRLREAVHRADRRERLTARVDAALHKLSLPLSMQQRVRIQDAYVEFQSRINQVWSQVKAKARETATAGGEVNRREIVTTTTAKIQQAFARTIGDVVNAADAESIAGALLPAGR